MSLADAANGPPFDAIVIGGGINGAGIGRELALAGLRIALLEANDFGFGTTWRSTRLIHGGLRYLEHGEVRLVRESLHERARLLRERPHLVRPQPFVLPNVPWARRPAWQVRAGLTMYDLLARGGGLPRHRAIASERMAELAPALTAEAHGGFSFYDARAVAPERLALELALEAAEAGATVANYATVTAITSRAGAVRGVEMETAEGGFELRAPHVINAAGPWVDAVATAAGTEGPKLLGLTRGSHVALEVPLEAVTRVAVLSTARSDGRVFFALPHSGLLLVGTTDKRHEGDPADVRPEPAELHYLLDEARALFPGAGLDATMVRYAYSGLRPLLASRGGPESAITRRHAVIDHARSGGPAGLYSVAGGKLSTYRPLAGQVLRHIGRRADLPTAARAHTTAPAATTGPDVRPHLARYGARAGSILDMGAEVLCEHAGAVTGEVVHTVRSEMATTVSDVLMRRTGIAWHSCRGLCCHRQTAALIGDLLGWDQAEIAGQVAAYERDVTRHLPTWTDVMSDDDGK